MRLVWGVMLMAVVSSAASSGEPEHPYLVAHFERCIAARRLGAPVIVDGKVEAAWRGASEVSGFHADR